MFPYLSDLRDPHWTHSFVAHHNTKEAHWWRLHVERFILSMNEEFLPLVICDNSRAVRGRHAVDDANPFSIIEILQNQQ